MKIKLFILTCCMLLSAVAWSQNIIVRGHIVNDKDEVVTGATVAEQGNEKNGAISDEQGNYAISLKPGSAKVLVITCVGYLPQVVTAVPGKLTPVRLIRDVRGLEDVVVVGYGRQKRITSTGAVSSIKAEEIKSIPTASIQNTLVGRLPGFFSQQRSGQPGADAADFFIRGINSLTGDNKPLIIVDDIEYDYTQLSQLNVNEVESVTILKDAATTSIYGLKGANGVLVVTTTRGRIGKPRINVTAEAGINKIIRMPTFLDSYTTALLRNEATINDAYGQSQAPVLPFTPDDLQKFKDGSDPYGHPNVNWSEVLFRKVSTQSRYNVDISGGNSLVRYFTSLGYYSQNGALKDFQPVGDYVNTNYFYRRYNYRSNLDITPTKTLKIRFDVNGRFETVNNPSGGVENAGLFYELGAFRYMAPYAMPETNPNGTASYATHLGAATNNGAINPAFRLGNGGYIRSFRNNYNIVVGADQQLDFITRGLSVKVNVSYAGNNNEGRNLNRSGLPAYKYNVATNTYSIRDAAQYRMLPYAVASTGNVFNSTTILQASLNYDRILGSHHFTGLLLLNQRNYINGAAIPVNYRGTTARLDYDFKRKYLLGVTVARNGNDLFQEDNRYGIFPAVSWGYNLSEEAFFKNLFPFFDLFKIRGSYGLVGSDANYPGTVTSVIQYATTGSNYYGNTTVEGALVNPDVTWEKERKTDLGLELNMFKGKVVFSGSYFYNYRYDQLIDQGGVPLLIGQGLPKKNIGKSENKGFDGMITYKNESGKIRYSIGANASYAINRILYISEAPDYPYQAKTGTQIGLNPGYHNIGFYQQSDFDENGKVKKGIPAPLWSVIQPGDLKYADMNGDGIITDADKTLLSKPNLPNTVLGAEFTIGYKGLSLRALLQGAYGYAVQVTAEGAGDAFNGNLRPWNLERWTPATAATATYPRLGLNTNINNISWQTISDFWFADTWYVRLKSLELSYQLPQAWIKGSKVLQNARVYASGYNLVNIQEMGKFQQDAEIANGTGGAYPNTANFIFGVQLGF
ncbi:TonB-linked outer membrane protein, SusC/RagA family [Chitinophaga jiangningensis]|uniref:TonB-linked outer membrane protein, SusC/RagA family n=1 Tax=Chitinophaga jiangningensis TaxID=1419482 RepID=A0A1M7JAV1_9BACT|nr:TonB-dependent receptor [Chitinophaga jiangningensis]SHM50125.1 TonB-linked outer membrane protein, SusC/RagA family [Chitinophaga jiangningensis]